MRQLLRSLGSSAAISLGGIDPTTTAAVSGRVLLRPKGSDAEIPIAEFAHPEVSLLGVRPEPPERS